MATQMTVNCTYNGYNAFNKAGLSINSGAAWDGWNEGQILEANTAMPV